MEGIISYIKDRLKVLLTFIVDESELISFGYSRVLQGLVLAKNCVLLV